MKNPRSDLIELVDEGIISGDYLIAACLKYMTNDEVVEMCELNEIDLNFLCGYEDEDED